MLEAGAILLGLAILVSGGELVVRAATQLAVSLRLSPIVIGLTVVAFSTSSPELAVSLGAALGGETDVAVGNVVGSNIYNILLILGISALVRPLIVRQQLVRFDVPVVIAASLLLWVLVLDGQLGALEGALLLALLVLYIGVSLRIARRQPSADPTRQVAGDGLTADVASVSRARAGAVFLAGVIALVVGAQLLVGGAVSIADAMGVSELVVGLTVVAIGTSLPELVTSVIATLRGQRDIAVGNVMGSNLFNILGILGLTALVARGGIPVPEQVRTFDLAVMTVVAFACLPLLFTGHVLRRWEGGLFTIYAVLYTLYVVLAATRHPLVEPFTVVMIVFVLPLTVITVVSVTVRAVDPRGRRARARSGD